MWKIGFLFVVCCANWILAAADEFDIFGIKSSLDLFCLKPFDFETKCVEDLGCFYSGPPFYDPPDRPSCLVPNDAPNTTRLNLFTQDKKDHPTVLNTTNACLETSTLDTSLATKFVLHGNQNKLPPDDLMFNISKELLEECGACNVIVVDYTGSLQFSIPQNFANARVVGAQLAKFINFHVHRRGLNPKDVHIIGHSLGSHVSGWVGERVPGLGRISGLDPGGPFNYNADPIVRLDPTDAEFVDVIHTNAADNIFQGFALYQPIGHIDFYPNGGQIQPGCGQLFQFPDVCAHYRAVNYFIESIRRCHFVGVKCSSYEDYENGICTPKNALTAEMGYHSVKVPTEPENSRFFLKTTSMPPFCINN